MIHIFKTIGIVLLVSQSYVGWAQKQLVLHKTTNDKRILIREDERVRVFFRADTVPKRRYRPLLYRKKDRRMAYTQGKIVGVTDQAIKLRPTVSIIDKIARRRADTLTITVDQVTAINKYHPAMMIGAFMLGGALVQGGVLLATAQTSALTPIIGINLLGFIAGPVMTKYIKNVGIPPRQLHRPRWELHVESL